MKDSLRNLAAPGRSVGPGLVMLLLLAVLVPSLCLLWFMNQAVKSERSAARQKIMDAYRGNLSLAQERLETRFEKIRVDLDRSLESSGPSATFALAVRSNLADAVICFDDKGNVLYPQTNSPPKPVRLPPEWFEIQQLESSDPLSAAKAFAQLADHANNSSLAARAMQAQLRCLLHADANEAALSLLNSLLSDKRFEDARDSQGRLIVADLDLMVLERTGAFASLSKSALADLKTRLADYGNDSLPAPQRRFLIRELQRLLPGQIEFPLLAAEDLAARVLQNGPIHADEPGIMRPGATPGIWQISSSHGRVLLLHRAENLEPRLASWIPSQNLPADSHVAFLPPGKNVEELLLPMPAGTALPGWRIALSLKDQRLFDAASDQRIASYLWIGVLVLGTVLVLAALVLRLVRRQIALTRLQNDLVANVTHELKTPLSSMRLLVDTLLNSGKLNEQTTREYLQLIAAENLRLSRLIDNFLTFSRIERNKYSFKFKELPAGRIMQQAADAIRDRFNVPGCQFQLQSSPNLPAIVADEDALVTVLINLLDNAFKYTGDQKQISLSAGAENGSVHFTVKDNGIGLSPRDTKRIFKRFYQVDQRLSRAGSGCGLGLSIVKFIVSAHHGNVEVESQPGKGSAFTVSIPARKKAEENI